MASLSETRFLTWYIHSLEGDLTSQGPVYVTDQDYYPHVVRVHCKRAPDAGDLTLDIKDDGVSIFSTPLPRLLKGATLDEVVEEFTASATAIARHSKLSLDLTPNGAKGISVHLELTAAGDEEKGYGDT